MQRNYSRRDFLQTSLAAAGVLWAPSLPAAGPPEGRLLFGFAATRNARHVFEVMLAELGTSYQPSLGTTVRAVPGNGGVNAIAALLALPRDGGVALVAPSSFLTLQPLIRKQESVDPATQLIPVGPLADFTFAFGVGPAVPVAVKTMRDYLQWVRANPSSAGYGIAALGTGGHFAGMEISRATGVPLQAIAYKGSLSLLDDLASGSVPAGITVLSNALDAARSGDIRVLGVTSAQRWPLAPQLPTMMELGLSAVPVDESFGLYLAAGTPAAKVIELTAALEATTRTTNLRKALEDSQMLTWSVPTGDYAAHLEIERRRWQTLIAQTGFRSES